MVILLANSVFSLLFLVSCFLLTASLLFLLECELLALLFVTIYVGAIAVLFLFISSNFLAEQKLTASEFLIITLFAIIGLVLLCSTNDFLSVAHCSDGLANKPANCTSHTWTQHAKEVDQGLSEFFVLGAWLLYVFLVWGILQIYYPVCKPETLFILALLVFVFLASVLLFSFMRITTSLFSDMALWARFVYLQSLFITIYSLTWVIALRDKNGLEEFFPTGDKQAFSWVYLEFWVALLFIKATQAYPFYKPLLVFLLKLIIPYTLIKTFFCLTLTAFAALSLTLFKKLRFIANNYSTFASQIINKDSKN